ncbi:MAG: hypothetical protein WAN35_15320 [Terracidiphilus sp.]
MLSNASAVEQKHLKYYIAEFNYRLKRRTVEPDLMVRLLRAGICTVPITYNQLVAMHELA